MDPNCNWCCTTAPGVAHLQLMFAHLQLVSQHYYLSFKICEWCCALHTQVLYHCTAHTGAVPLYCTHRCCTTVLHTQMLYHCTAHTGAVQLYCAQWRMEPPGKSLGQTPWGPAAPQVFGLGPPLGNPPTTIPPRLLHTLSPNLRGTSQSFTL